MNCDLVVYFFIVSSLHVIAVESINFCDSDFATGQDEDGIYCKNQVVSLLLLYIYISMYNNASCYIAFVVDMGIAELQICCNINETSFSGKLEYSEKGEDIIAYVKLSYSCSDEQNETVDSDVLLNKIMKKHAAITSVNSTARTCELVLEYRDEYAIPGVTDSIEVSCTLPQGKITQQNLSMHIVRTFS